MVLGLIFQLRDYFSEWVQYVVLISLVIIIILIIYIEFCDVIFAKYNKIKDNKRHKKAASKYIEELESLVDNFERIIENNNNITNAFERLRSETELFKYMSLNDSQLN